MGFSVLPLGAAPPLIKVLKTTRQVSQVVPVFPDQRTGVASKAQCQPQHPMWSAQENTGFLGVNRTHKLVWAARPEAGMLTRGSTLTAYESGSTASHRQ